MAQVNIEFAGETLALRGSGTLYWPRRRMLVVSDLHLGKSERIARRGGTLLPPFDTAETLDRLAEELTQTAPENVLCLGDSFDDLAAAEAIKDEVKHRLAPLQAGRRWIWAEGNHDPGPVDIGGTHVAEFTDGPLSFRHIATATGAGEISGHYHPKARIKLQRRALVRPCFVFDNTRLILPAFGAYTGGLWVMDPAIAQLLGAQAKVVLTGKTPHLFPCPRA